MDELTKQLLIKQIRITPLEELPDSSLWTAEDEQEIIEEYGSLLDTPKDRIWCVAYGDEIRTDLGFAHDRQDIIDWCDAWGHSHELCKEWSFLRFVSLAVKNDEAIRDFVSVVAKDVYCNNEPQEETEFRYPPKKKKGG